MSVIYNDRPVTRADMISPQTSPTLKLARHGGGTLGGPVKVFTSNPFSFYHKNGEVMAAPTLLTENRFRQPDHAMLSEIRNYRYNADLASLAPAPMGRVQPGGAGGQFVWPDTSIGTNAAPPVFGAAPYPEPAAKPPSLWQQVVGLIGGGRKGR